MAVADVARAGSAGVLRRQKQTRTFAPRAGCRRGLTPPLPAV